MAPPEHRYARLEPLVRASLTVDEDGPTAELIIRMRGAKRRGYLTPGELQAVCHWKSPRAIRLVRKNSPRKIRTATRAALATRSERRRLEALRNLDGVSVPMASALLTLVDPRRYGVIDIRVWQLLHRAGVVATNARGVGFSTDNWLEFLAIVRHLAKTLGVQARHVERTMFNIHAETQTGRLYESVRR